MQNVIAKYALAAHLALLAVAPLLLFPFFGDGTVALVLLWLSLPAAAWTFLQPSVRRGEMLHDARSRLARAVFRDPLFWGFLMVVLFCGVRALNVGVAMVYDAEISKWILAPAAMPLFPASCGEAGLLPFAASIAVMVVVMGCRHALGRSARQAWFFVASVLAGTAAVVSVFLANIGNEEVRAAMRCSQAGFSFVGMAFAMHFAGGIVALTAAIENKWNRVVPLMILSIGGTALGSIAFLPPYAVGVFAVAQTLVFAYSFVYCLRAVRSVAEFKMVMIFALALACGWVIAVMTGVSGLVTERAAAVVGRDILTESLMRTRDVVSAAAVKAWMVHPWTGTGIGSFALDLRFNVQAQDWAFIPRGLVAPPFGWLCILTERGIVGVAALVLPWLFLLVIWVVRLIGWLFVRTLPQPACWIGPIVCAAVAVTGLWDCSCFRADVLMAAYGMLALSASSFPKKAAGG